MIVMVCVEPDGPGAATRTALAMAASLANAAEVVALVAGGSDGNDALDEARRSEGVGRVVFVKESTLGNADFFTLGMVLAEAARALRASVVLAGERSDEEGQGLVSAALAYHLRTAIVAHVSDIRIAAPDAEVVEVDVLAAGRLCKVECNLPVVLAVPAMTSSRKNQRSKVPSPVEVMSLAHLGLDPSRLVPRPALLGELEPVDGSKLSRVSFEQAAEMILFGGSRNG